jgi:hypothetical protein
MEMVGSQQNYNNPQGDYANYLLRVDYLIDIYKTSKF